MPRKSVPQLIPVVKENQTNHDIIINKADRPLPQTHAVLMGRTSGNPVRFFIQIQGIREYVTRDDLASIMVGISQLIG